MSESKLTKLSFLILGLASFGLTDRIQNNGPASDFGVGNRKFGRQEVKIPSINHQINQKQKFETDIKDQKQIHKLFNVDYPSSKVGARLEPRMRLKPNKGSRGLYKLYRDKSNNNQLSIQTGDDETNIQQLFKKDFVDEIRHEVQQIQSQQAQADLTPQKATFGEPRFQKIMKLWQEATPEQKASGLDMIESFKKENNDSREPIQVGKRI